MGWKRKLFFLFEKLKITPAERKSVGILLVLLAILASANRFIKPAIAVDEEHYAALKVAFDQRSEEIKQQEVQLLVRYNPIAYTVQDTIPKTDSAKADTLKSEHKNVIDKINVNTADLKTLQKLTGIGPTYAQHIIDYRNGQGNFTSFEELLKIKGIGKKRLEKIKPFIKLKE